MRKESQLVVQPWSCFRATHTHYCIFLPSTCVHFMSCIYWSCILEDHQWWGPLGLKPPVILHQHLVRSFQVEEFQHIHCACTCSSIFDMNATVTDIIIIIILLYYIMYQYNECLRCIKDMMSYEWSKCVIQSSALFVCCINVKMLIKNILPNRSLKYTTIFQSISIHSEWWPEVGLAMKITLTVATCHMHCIIQLLIQVH